MKNELNIKKVVNQSKIYEYIVSFAERLFKNVQNMFQVMGAICSMSDLNSWFLEIRKENDAVLK